MKNQLELLKPPPEGTPPYWNIPLLASLAILGSGLVIVMYCLAQEDGTTVLWVKCSGPVMVMMGVTVMLLRILTTNTPTSIVHMSRRIRR